ncbi:MAG: low temperature requirement protein A, partial [Actinobacteria bacterium]|nr:low temperature requirement protein A [Actinomycetota bacterium]
MAQLSTARGERTARIAERLRGRGVIRDFDEERTSSHLELFFDLTFVVGVSRASTALHHELVAGHVAHGIVGFIAAFFAIWWAWMSFTWFASAHESDDVTYRLLALVQMTGVLVLAAGLSRAVEHNNFSVATIGYAIMRIGLVIDWLRVARDQPTCRTRALRYASSITVLQVLWFLRLATPHSLVVPTFVVLGLAELTAPYWAERASTAPMFNPRHIDERYGLFTLIVLGETILAASTGFQTVLDKAGVSADLLAVGFGGLLLAFAVWWLYFDHPGHLTPSPGQAFRWGYGHVFVFLSLAALGAGVYVAAEAVVHNAPQRVGAMAVAVPSAGFLLGLALVMVLTGTPALSYRVWPKWTAAAVIVVIGLVVS